MNEWQPIETSPKDGELILACRAGYLPQTARYSSSLEYTGWITVDEDDDELFSAWVEYGYRYSPTHWMPLPEPPK